MPDLVRLAMRNVCRYPRRTAITTAAVAFGVGVMIVAGGFVEFTLRGLRESIVYGGLGHLQVRAEDDDLRSRLDATLVDALRRAVRADGRVETYGARLGFEGLVSSARATLAVSGLGVEMPAEASLRRLMLLSSGEWFTGGERVPKVLLGRGLARRLRAEPRAMLTLVAYSDAGRMTATDLQVSGVFETGVVEYDARTLLVPLRVARDLMETSGASSIAATVHRPVDVPPVRARLARTVASAGKAGDHVLPWEALSPVFASVVALYRWMLRAFVGVVVLVVVLGIANTMSMAVLERVAEVGVLRAIGFGRPRVVLLFLAEAICIGALGAVAGTVAGSAACRTVTALEIAMPPPPGNSQGYLLEIPIVGTAVLASSGVAILAAVVAGLLPALRAVRGEVVDALRA